MNKREALEMMRLAFLAELAVLVAEDSGTLAELEFELDKFVYHVGR